MIGNIARRKRAGVVSRVHAARALAGLAGVLVGLAAARGQELVLTNLTDPAPVNNNAVWDTGNDSNPSIATDGLGNWVCAWQSTNIPGGGVANDQDILVARSTDAGATWTDPAYLNHYAAADTGADTSVTLATDGAGTWVAAWVTYENLGGTIGTDPDLVFARSFDNGVTWTAPAVLASTAYTDGDAVDAVPHVATDGAGVWICVWEAERILGTGIDRDIFYAVSTDGGATWTPVRFLNSRAQVDGFAIDGNPRIARDRQGTWLCVWQSQDDLGGQITSDYDILFALSSDYGASWSSQELVNSNGWTDSGFDQQPAVASVGAGRWLVAWHSYDTLNGTIGSDLDVLYSLTPDDGQTWTSAAPLNATAWNDERGDWGVHVEGQENGLLLAVWTSDENLGGTIGTDDDLLYAFSGDGGQLWTYPGVLNRDAYWDNAFNRWIGLAHDRQNRWVVPWSGRDLGGWIYGTDWDVLDCGFGIAYLGDLDSDQDVDLEDFTIFQLCFGGSANPPAPACPADVDADFDDDGDVDLRDFLSFQRNYTGSR